MVKVERVGKRWVCKTTFAERHAPAAAGFRCDPTPGPNGERVWFTTDPEVAARLMDPDEAEATLAAGNKKFQLNRDNIIASAAQSAAIDVPANPGFVYDPYQLAAVAGMLPRPHILLADEPGLGKTIEVAGLINMDPTLRKILIIAPNSLRLNWQRELARWLVNPCRTAIFSATFCRPEWADICIIHYEVVARWAALLRSTKWDLIVADECHLIKNPSAKRSIAILGLDKKTAKKEEKKRQEKLAQFLPGADIPRELRQEIVAVEPLRGRRSAFLTGTPLPNRPKEVFPLAHYLDPVTFKSERLFKKNFCNSFWNGHGTDDSGDSNLRELQGILRSTIMIRRLKSEVMKELPPKRRAIIEIPHNNQEKVKAELDAYKEVEARLAAMRAAVAAAKASDDRAGYALAAKKLKAAHVMEFAKISKQRHDTAVAKLPYVLDHLRTLISGGEKIVCFAHHKDIIEAIAGEFGKAAVTIYGPTPVPQRQAAVDRFQSDPTCLLAVGGYGPMGVGWTLVASSHVVAAELDWVPGNMTQAEDRCHRKGQHDMVLVEHLVLEGSLDAYMAQTVVQKQRVQAEALDMDEVPPECAVILGTVSAAGALAAPDGPGTPRRPPPPPVRPQEPEIARPRPLGQYQQARLFE